MRTQQLSFSQRASNAWKSFKQGVKNHCVLCKSAEPVRPRANDSHHTFRHLLDRKVSYEDKAKFWKSEAKVGAACTASVFGAIVGIPHLIACGIGYAYNKHQSKKLDAPLKEFQLPCERTIPQFSETRYNNFKGRLLELREKCMAHPNKEYAKAVWADAMEHTNELLNGNHDAQRGLTTCLANIEEPGFADTPDNTPTPSEDGGSLRGDPEIQRSGDYLHIPFPGSRNYTMAGVSQADEAYRVLHATPEPSPEPELSEDRSMTHSEVVRDAARPNEPFEQLESYEQQVPDFDASYGYGAQPKKKLTPEQFRQQQLQQRTRLRESANEILRENINPRRQALIEQYRRQDAAGINEEVTFSYEQEPTTDMGGHGDNYRVSPENGSPHSASNITRNGASETPPPSYNDTIRAEVHPQESREQSLTLSQAQGEDLDESVDYEARGLVADRMIHQAESDALVNRITRELEQARSESEDEVQQSVNEFANQSTQQTELPQNTDMLEFSDEEDFPLPSAPPLNGSPSAADELAAVGEQMPSMGGVIDPNYVPAKDPELSDSESLHAVRV